MSNEVVIYNINEVSKLLKVTVSTIKRYINQGKLSAFKVGNSWRITKDDINEFIAKNRYSRPN